MKRTDRAKAVFTPCCDEEADPQTRAQFRAHFPAQFEVTDAGGQKWYDIVERMPLAPDCELTWLWPGLIPNGQLTVIEGETGAGKSYVVLDLITRVTRGLPFPQVPGHESVPETPPASGKVVLITLQDYCAGVSKRLKVLGADTKNLHLEGYISRRRADNSRLTLRPFDFALDLKKLQQELMDLPSIRLVVIDPLCDFCQGPAHVAQMLAELRNMAQLLEIPIVVTLPAQTRFDADRKSTRLNSSHVSESRMPSSA